MLSLARSGTRFFAENHGQNRDAGTERTSATVSAPAARSIAVKHSAARLECPMLKISNLIIVRINRYHNLVRKRRRRFDALYK
jgi:hypothetical protein